MSSACPFSPFTTPHRAPPRRAHSTARRPLVVTHRLCTMFSVSATASRAHAAPAFVNKVSKVRPFSTTLSLARARDRPRAFAARVTRAANGRRRALDPERARAACRDVRATRRATRSTRARAEVAR